MKITYKLMIPSNVVSRLDLQAQGVVRFEPGPGSNLTLTSRDCFTVAIAAGQIRKAHPQVHGFVERGVA